VTTDREDLQARIRRAQGALKRTRTKAGEQKAESKLILLREELARMKMFDTKP
jgi:hypothetical protein